MNCKNENGSMRTYRFNDNDLARLDALIEKITKAAEKEGMKTRITKVTILRALLLKGEKTSVKERLDLIKEVKIYYFIVIIIYYINKSIL